ncbi:Flp family type IVb pilin [Burkholderia sp. Bp8963]|uniref:Flp family type IVb pilin n=1 Tax=Burkholderia sp. Bp8963 TaxID=2184547 RepID=UPI000F599C81|nr:Flp family type IVb pilin [Burkholderia sp. Bp8963]RQS69532.1 Flp family type IVb pilin [Burkholderia sp. Bp8963]
MSAFVYQVQQFARDEGGVTAIEYGLLAVLIAVALMAGATLLGSNLDTLFSSLGTMM